MTPSSFSNPRIADDRAGCDTWQASAAFAKCLSRARVTRYSSWRMNIVNALRRRGQKADRSPRLFILSPPPRTPEKFPAEAVFIVGLIHRRIIGIVAALALSSDTPTH